MDRMAILWLILAALTGCQGPTTPIDPFATYGPSRIPPPATGSARRGDPYYRGSLASSAPSAASTSGIAAQGVPVMSRFTSEDPGGGAVQMADRRAADTSPVTGNGPSSSTRRLDWRSPTSDSQSYQPSSAPSPRPRFPSTSTENTGVVGLPNQPLVQQGPAAITPVPPGPVYGPNGQVAPAGYQPPPTGLPAGEARY